MVCKSKLRATSKSPVKVLIVNDGTTFAGDSCWREYTSAPLEPRSLSTAMNRLMMVPTWVPCHGEQKRDSQVGSYNIVYQESLLLMFQLQYCPRQTSGDHWCLVLQQLSAGMTVLDVYLITNSLIIYVIEPYPVSSWPRQKIVGICIKCEDSWVVVSYHKPWRSIGSHCDVSHHWVYFKDPFRSQGQIKSI